MTGFPSKHPVGPGCVGEDQRDKERSPDKHENEAALRSRGVDDAHSAWHDVRIDADPQSDKAKQKQSERECPSSEHLALMAA